MQSRIEQKNELEKWVSGLSSQTLTNLKKTLEVLIPFWEVFASNPLHMCRKSVSEFEFEKNNVPTNVALNLIMSIEQRMGDEVLFDEVEDIIVLHRDVVNVLKSLLVTVESVLLSGDTKNLPRRAIEKSGNDEYFIGGKIIPFTNKKALYYRIFKFLFDRANGEATYKEIDTHLGKMGHGVKESVPAMSERIRNAIAVYEKNRDYPQKIGERKIFETIGGGIRLNNPEI